MEADTPADEVCHHAGHVGGWGAPGTSALLRRCTTDRNSDVSKPGLGQEEPGRGGQEAFQGPLGGGQHCPQ